MMRLQTSLVASLLVVLLTSCNSDPPNSPELKKLSRGDAGRFLSGILMMWRGQSSTMQHVAEHRMFKSRDEAEAPFSWRFALMGGSGDLEAPPIDLNSDWQSKSNEYWRTNATLGRKFSFCPTEELSYRGPQTSIMALRGEDTAFDAAFEGTKSEDMEKDTIVLVEVTNSNVHWMEPGDLDISTMPKQFNAPGKVGIGGHYPGGFFIGFADGNVWFIKETVPFETLEKFFTLESAQKHDREKELDEYVIERIKPWEDLYPSK